MKKVSFSVTHLTVRHSFHIVVLFFFHPIQKYIQYEWAPAKESASLDTEKTLGKTPDFNFYIMTFESKFTMKEFIWANRFFNIFK